RFLLTNFDISFYQFFSYSGTTRISLSWKENIRKMSLPGIASALDIGFSNWSFEFITISLYTMTKSTCIVFILAFAILFDLEKLVRVTTAYGSLLHLFIILPVLTFSFL